jgi:hypothetical protein
MGVLLLGAKLFFAGFFQVCGGSFESVVSIQIPVIK